MHFDKDRPDQKRTMTGATSEDRIAAANLRARARLVRKALVLGVSLVLLASLCFVVASHIGFEHMACKMAEDALGSALSHARSLARRIEDPIVERHGDGGPGLGERLESVRRQLRALVNDDPTMLYGMLLSSDGEILVHSEVKHERHRAGYEGDPSPLFASAREFPEGRLAYKEFVYEVRTPLGMGSESRRMLVLGLSRRRIDRHIAKVRREVRLKMLLSGGIGLVVLLVPGAGLWLVLRRYRQLAEKSQEMALMAQLGAMANGLVHEVRNPLNAIRFNLKILEEDADHFPEEIREGYGQVIARAVGEIGRLDDLLTEYLSYVRPGPREPKPQDLNGVVESVLGFVEYECGRHRIRIQRNLSDKLPEILVDERQLKQALLNVVVNARQALCPEGGTITATSHQHDGTVVLEIADDGPGIPEEQRAKIFEPFYTNREGGTGLGLAIARRLVEDYGGTIDCSGNAGPGATFVMTFPRHQDGAPVKE